MGDAFDLVEYQVGSEAAWGDGAAATAKLMGLNSLTLPPTVEAQMIEEMRGSLARSKTVELANVEGGGEFEGMLSFEDICYWFDALFGQATPSGAGPYTYDYSAPAGTAPSLRTLALYKGFGSTCYKLEGGVISELTISGETGQAALGVSGSLMGENVVTGSLASLSDRDVNYVLGSGLELWIDTFGSSPGTTQITGLSFLSFELSIASNVVLDPSLTSLTPAGYHPRKYSGSLQVHLELNATTKAFLDAILGASAVFQRIVRIKSTRGTNSLTLDFAGSTLEAPEPITEADGLVSLDFTLEDTEDASGLGNWFVAEVINDLSSLP